MKTLIPDIGSSGDIYTFVSLSSDVSAPNIQADPPAWFDHRIIIFPVIVSDRFPL